MIRTTSVRNRATLRVIIVALLTFLSKGLSSQPPLFKSPVYIQHYAEEAISQMAEYRIPASVILAQAIFESACGSSDLAKRSNNHFGIKCHVEWGGDTIVKNDDTLNECFRRYRTVEDSYTDHSLFLTSRARYSQLFNYSILDYKSWCIGLKACGYATYPLYAQELIKIIEENNLYEMDGIEKMERANICLRRNEEILSCNISLSNVPLEDILKNEALFVDEKYVLVQSLELLMTDQEPYIAGK